MLTSDRHGSVVCGTDTSDLAPWRRLPPGRPNRKGNRPMQRKRLSDILRAGNGGGGADWINDNWGDIPPAPDFGTPVPRGHYITHVLEGALFEAGTGTPGYKVTHEIIEGEHTGRRLWQDIWLSGAAKRGAVRDLAKLGIRDKQQLEQPIPLRRIRCKVTVVVRR